MDDADIDTSDIPGAGEEFFSRAKLRLGGLEITPAEIVMLRLEPELAAWVRSIVPSRSQDIAAALKRLRLELNPAKP
jgi:hypothetical protein